MKRYQYTAIDDGSRARTLKIYSGHNQQCAVAFVDYVRDKFPLRIPTIQTDYGHEFQAKFHWHCEGLGIRHLYMKKASSHLNRKVERSYLTDQTEFYQLLEYKDAIDIKIKLKEWGHFYNYHRSNEALKGKDRKKFIFDRLSTVVLVRTLMQG